MKRKVLFLCTSNSARSQMAEAILNYRAADRFAAYSAGSEPASQIHPLAMEVMSRSGIETSSMRPKSIQEFIHEDFDFIITLCDKMREKCPVFPGRPILAHWGLPDPANFSGGEAEKIQMFRRTMIEVSQRISLFLDIPLEKLDRMAVEKKVKEIGTQALNTNDGATE